MNKIHTRPARIISRDHDFIDEVQPLAALDQIISLAAAQGQRVEIPKSGLSDEVTFGVAGDNFIN